MKKYILYIGILAALLAVPAEKSDVGRLLPVEAISIYKGEGTVRIETDTGNVGTGEDLEMAYQDLCRSAPAEIFLDTADYLILRGEGAELIEQLRWYLKPGIRVCGSGETVDLASAAEYLSIHVPGKRLKDIHTGTGLEVLTQTETGFWLE